MFWRWEKSEGEELSQWIGLSGAVRPKRMDDGVSGGDALCKKCDVCRCGVVLVVGFCGWIGSGQDVA